MPARVSAVETELLGVDFSCSPSPRKPITVARGRRRGATLHLDRVDALASLAAFRAMLAEPRRWFGAFDFPFGLPRVFVEANGFGDGTAAVIAAVRRRCPTRMAWRAFIDAWGNDRPAGKRLLHRVTDTATPVASTSPLQTRYVPVGLMYYEGVAALVDCGVTLAGLHAGDPARVAVEGYPRRLAHRVVGRRSYKNSALPDRREARAEIVAALERGVDGTRLRLGDALRAGLVDEPSGDRLDAVLCLVQAADAAGRPRHAMPDAVDPVEGWIVG